MKRRQLSRKIKHFINQPAFYMAVLIVGSSSGCVDTRQRATIAPQQPVPQTAAPNNLNFIANVVQDVGQAVVRLDATRTVDVPSSFGNPIIERFRFFSQEFLPPQQRVQRGVGSGFIVSNDGMREFWLWM